MQKLVIPLQRKRFNLLKDETKRKRQQVLLASLFRHAIFEDPTIKNKYQKINNIYYCGHYRNYLLNTKEDHKRLDFGMFCGERLCPICGKKKAYRARIKLITMFNYLNKHYCYKSGRPKYLPVFATFTIPNVPDDIKSFRRTYKKLHHKFYKMMSLHKFCGFLRDKKHHKGVIQGGVSKIEVTYNQEADTFHLHLHALLLVHLSYFSSRYYLPFKEWQSAWEKQWNWNPMRHWNNKNNRWGVHLQVKIERPFFKDKNGIHHKITNADQASGADQEAITEVTGYETKSNDVTTLLDPKNSKSILNRNFKQAQKAFDTAYFGTKNQNTYTHFGLLKKLARMYNDGIIDDYKPQDPHVYEYNLNAKYNEEAKEFSTKESKLSKDKMKELEKRGIKTVLAHKNSSVDLNTCGPIVYAKISAQHKLAKIDYEKSKRIPFKDYKNLCKRAGIVFKSSSPTTAQANKSSRTSSRTFTKSSN